MRKVLLILAASLLITSCVKDDVYYMPPFDTVYCVWNSDSTEVLCDSGYIPKPRIKDIE